MCGAGVARSWCRGGSGGARDSQLFWGYFITGILSKIHLDITTTTTTEEHFIIRIEGFHVKKQDICPLTATL